MYEHGDVLDRLAGNRDQASASAMMSFRFTSSLRPCRMIPTMRPPSTALPPANMLPGGTSRNEQFTYSRGAPVIWACTAVTASATSAFFRAIALPAGTVNW